MTQRRPRRPLDVCPTIALIRNVTEAMAGHRPRPGLDWFCGTDAFGWKVESLADIDQARREMEFEAVNQGSKTNPCRLPFVHLAIDWPALRPTADEMKQAGRDALAALGMGNGKAVFVGRNGWQTAELHVFACKIDPATNRAYQLHRSHTRLNWWARRYGRGWPA